MCLRDTLRFRLSAQDSCSTATGELEGPNERWGPRHLVRSCGACGHPGRCRRRSWLSAPDSALAGVSDLERGIRRAPHLETVRLLADALALAEHDRAALLAAARSPSRSDRHTPIKAETKIRLPRPLTQLVGRDEESAALRSLLGHEHVRLVTLTDPGESARRGWRSPSPRQWPMSLPTGSSTLISRRKPRSPWSSRWWPLLLGCMKYKVRSALRP